MTKRNPFPSLASQREIDREPAMPTPGDWIGGIALAVIIVAGTFFVGAFQ